MEILIPFAKNRPGIKAALFDFDGTISTLRYGWEGVMEPLMIEMISGGALANADKELVREIREYINQSTGIQTIYQMKWLAEAVKRHQRNPDAPGDPWWYKSEYNRRLMEIVDKRKNSLIKGDKKPEDYLIRGAKKFLEALKEKGIEIYVASGTDHPDVVQEAEVLKLKEYFKEISGAPPGREDCSKEAVLRDLVYGNKLQGQEVVVIGDGKVEIALGREVGAITLGVASDEEKLCGINPVKRERLVKAGAHAIVGDFEDLDEILDWLGIG